MPKTVTINARFKKVINKADPKKSKMGKKGSQNNQLFSGKVLGMEIPGAKKVLQNKTLQKVLVGAGTVSVGLSIVQLLNNKKLNELAAKKEVRILAAGATGDIPGAAYQFLKEDGFKQISSNGAQQTQQVQQNTQMRNREGFA